MFYCYVYIVTSLHCYIVTLLHCYIVTLLHCYIVTAPGVPVSLRLLSVTNISALLQWEKPVVTNGAIRTYQLQHKQREQTDAGEYK